MINAVQDSTLVRVSVAKAGKIEMVLAMPLGFAHELMVRDAMGIVSLKAKLLVDGTANVYLPSGMVIQFRTTEQVEAENG